MTTPEPCTKWCAHGYCFCEQEAAEQEARQPEQPIAVETTELTEPGRPA